MIVKRSLYVAVRLDVEYDDECHTLDDVAESVSSEVDYKFYMGEDSEIEIVDTELLDVSRSSV